MSNPHDHDQDGAPRRSPKTPNVLTIVGVAVVLGVATLSAHMISGESATVKPASGSAQAMSLAGSDQPAP